MDNNTIVTAFVDDEQRSKTVEAKTAMVTEAKRELLWLKGYGIFWVFGISIFVEVTTNKFPLTVATWIGLFVFFKTFIDTKPEGYLYHLLAYALWLPKKLSHRSESTERFDRIKHLRKRS